LPFDLRASSKQVVVVGPLVARDKNFGFLIAVANRPGGAFAASDAEAMGIVAGQAVAALDNVRLIEEISAAYRELQSLDRLKSEFINIAAHELRTPLAVLMGYALLMVDEMTGTEHEQMQYIISNAERLRRVVDDMLSLRYLETGQAELRLEELMVADAVRAVVGAYKSLADEKQQRLELHLSENLGLIRADRAMLDLMLGNLLSNAIKFGPPNSEIVVRAHGDEKQVSFSVRDHGKGVPPSEHERIFARFYQIENSLTRQHGGLGLGLAMTREMVRAHQGRIWLESSPGEGSTFHITLPRRMEVTADPLCRNWELLNPELSTQGARAP
jgi:signal transduction histidine kinase